MPLAPSSYYHNEPNQSTCTATSGVFAGIWKMGVSYKIWGVRKVLAVKFTNVRVFHFEKRLYSVKLFFINYLLDIAVTTLTRLMCSPWV